LTVSTVTTLRN